MHSEFQLELTSISKAFPGVQALDRTNLSIHRGEIHGLVGENGAGKSTIIKVLAGVYERDSGTITIAGQSIDDVTPTSIHAAGVRFIHQELHLVPHFTVTESVFMGQEWSGPLGLQRRKMRKKAERFLKDALNIELSGKALIRDLGIAQRKLVQIARALIDEQATLVVFDEPTAPLASADTEQVFKAIRRLHERGITIIYVSHYLGEITQLCDRVTVFRNGADVAVMEDVNSNSTGAMINHMVGRDIDALYPQKNHHIGGVLFSASGLTKDLHFSNINFDVGKGEILGIAGLIGSGREELVDTLYGLMQPSQGGIHFNGQELELSSPASAVENGIVLVPRDRRHDGLVLDMSVRDNINLASLDDVAILRMHNSFAAKSRAEKLSETLDIRPRNTQAIVRFLSGGNQQKVVLARWLATESKLYILDEPTVGVDIGAKVEIYQLIENLVAGGAGVIVSSSDPGELLGLCDRIIVMHRGELIADQAAKSLALDSLISLTSAGETMVEAIA